MKDSLAEEILRQTLYIREISKEELAELQQKGNMNWLITGPNGTMYEFGVSGLERAINEHIKDKLGLK